MRDQDRSLRGVRRFSGKQRRAGNQELWISAPLQNAIRSGLDAREWTISDLGRAIGSQPSLISRWMMGSRPSPERLIAVAAALELDANHLLALAGHIPASMDSEVDRRTQMLVNKLQDIEMTDERFAYLNGLLEVMRKTPIQGNANARDDANGQGDPQPVGAAVAPPPSSKNPKLRRTRSRRR